MGRRAKPYEFGNEHINGLYRRPGTDKWKITAAKPPIEFRCSDELAAIARFRKWETSHKSRSVILKATTVKSKIGSFLESQQQLRAMVKAKEGGLDKLTDDEVQDFVDDTTEFNWQNAQDLADIPVEIICEAFKAQLFADPKRIAELMSMPALAEPHNLVVRTASHSVIDLMEEYLAKRKPVRASEVRRIVKDFCSTANVKTVNDIHAKAVQDWGDSVEKGDYSAATIRDIFSTIKRVVAFGLTRAEYDKSQIRRALDEMAVLVAPENSKTLDPKPISKEYFAMLLNAAVAEQDAIAEGQLLVMLNLCMYPMEAAKLKWAEIDLNAKTVVAERSKTKVVRIGVLWDRTIKALEKLPHKGEYVFVSNRGTHFKPSGIKDRFVKLKGAAVKEYAKDKTETEVRAMEANLAQVKMNHIRDGAYTAAIQGGASPETARLLAGHRTGIADHYVKRNASMVKGACEAVERHYFQ